MAIGRNVLGDSRMPLKMTNLQLLGDINSLRKRCIAISLIDAIICQGTTIAPRYTFGQAESTRDTLAQMQDLAGSDYFIYFDKERAVIKGFNKHSSYNESGIDFSADDLPHFVNNFLKRYNIESSEATFLLWSERFIWSGVKRNDSVDDEPLGLLDILIEGAEVFREWVSEYYERELDLGLLDSIFSYKPIDKFLIKSINKKAKVDKIANIAKIMGYPLSI